MSIGKELASQARHLDHLMMMPSTLSRRDPVAAAALQALLARDAEDEPRTLALWSVEYADALIAELDKEKSG